MTDIVKRLRDPVLVERNDGIRLEAADEVERLREALKECAAEWESEPCTMATAGAHLLRELVRRMEIARSALDADRRAR